ncbi:MAG: NAD(P)/FAD-dependent oxidoreductase [Candidatus Omnitrophica bacterium]|nr:NAD(P)/FAD-dependent oxidoreductase [Candidatus Omnitrophota bacterium]
MSEYVIIGASAAGLSCCEAIREKDKKGKITIISDEKEMLYSRCLLTYLIGDKIGRDGLKFKADDFYKKHNIDAMHGVKAVMLDIKKKTVKLDNGKAVEFDKLLIATGATPKKVGIEGEGLKGVFSLRSIADAEGIISMVNDCDTAAILGGGLIGLRDAYALRLRGKKVKVVVKSSQILSQMLDKDAADIIEEKLTKEGIEVIKGLAAKKIKGKGKVAAVELEDGSEIECQMVIIGKGVSTNLNFAKEAGIKVETGIVADEYMQTSAKDVYTAGDVAEALDITTGLHRNNSVWPVAVEQGHCAGHNMAGNKTPYEGSCMMNATDFFGLPVVSIGITKPKGTGYEELTVKNSKEKVYKKIVLKDNIIRGIILLTEIANAGVYGILLKKRIDISPIKDRLLDDNFDYAKILHIVKERADKFGKAEFKETTITL